MSTLTLLLMAPVEKGNQVVVEYTGTLEDGSVFDSTDEHNGEPLIFVTDSGMMIPGFDDAVIGMEVGEEKEITLEPKDAYGDYDERAVQKVPKSNFPKNFNPETGMMLQLGTPDGHRFVARVAEVEDDTVTLDMNHELAGKVLNFKIKMLEYGEQDERSEHTCGPECGDECGGSCGHDEE